MGWQYGLGLCPVQCSQDKLWIHHDPHQDKMEKNEQKGHYTYTLFEKEREILLTILFYFFGILKRFNIL